MLYALRCVLPLSVSYLLCFSFTFACYILNKLPHSKAKERLSGQNARGKDKKTPGRLPTKASLQKRPVWDSMNRQELQHQLVTEHSVVPLRCLGLPQEDRDETGEMAQLSKQLTTQA